LIASLSISRPFDTPLVDLEFVGFFKTISNMIVSCQKNDYVYPTKTIVSRCKRVLVVFGQAKVSDRQLDDVKSLLAQETNANVTPSL
jgi:hypothetical protein